MAALLTADMRRISPRRRWYTAILVARALLPLVGYVLLFPCSRADAGDRLGWTLSAGYTPMRDNGGIRDWIDYTAMTRGVDFPRYDREFGGSFGALIFRDRIARAGLEVYLLLGSVSGRDRSNREWIASSGHVGVEIFYAVNLIRPPGPFVPYIGAGLGMDVPYLNLNLAGSDTTEVPGSVFARERLGYWSLVTGGDCFLSSSFAFGFRAKYLMARTGTLTVVEAHDTRLVGRDLPSVQSLVEHPDDPDQWTAMHYNKSAFVVTLQLTFHHRQTKAPGVSDD